MTLIREDIKEPIGDFDTKQTPARNKARQELALKVADELCNILAKDGSNKHGGISEGQRLLNIRSYIADTIKVLRGESQEGKR